MSEIRCNSQRILYGIHIPYTVSYFYYSNHHQLNFDDLCVHRQSRQQSSSRAAAEQSTHTDRDKQQQTAQTAAQTAKDSSRAETQRERGKLSPGYTTTPPRYFSPSDS